MSYQQNFSQPPYSQYQELTHAQYVAPNWTPDPQPGWETYPNQSGPQGYPLQPNYVPSQFPPHLPDQNYQPVPLLPQRPVFQWTSPSSSMLNSSVRDLNGQKIFTINTPKKKETMISGDSGQIIAKLEWRSTPTISLRGAKAMKIKDWIPFDKRTDCRALNIQGDSYRLADQNGSVAIFKNSLPSHVGLIGDPDNILHLELAPDVLPLLEEFVIIATILQSGHDIEKSGWFNSRSFQMGMIGGLGGAVAASS